VTRISFSSWVYLVVAVLSIAVELYPLPGVERVIPVLIILFLMLEFTTAPRTQQVVAVLLCSAGLAIGMIMGSGMEVMVDGLRRSQLFLVLFAAVAWLQIPAGQSPSLNAARETVEAQPPGRRFLVLAGAAHGLGAVLNLAGISLLSSMIGKQESPAIKKRLTRGLMIGFSSGSCWSPFFVGTAVILSILPSVRWLEVAPFGMAAGILIIAGGWIFDRTFVDPGPRSAPAPPVPLPLPARWRLAGVLLTLFVIVIGMVEIAGLSIPIVLGLVAPPYALIWVLSFSERRPSAAAAALVTRVVGGLAGLRSEALLFVGANMFGAGVASVVTPDMVGNALSSLAWPPQVMIACLIAGIIWIGALGLHPVVPVVLIGQVLPPEVLGVAPEIMGLAMLTTWGLSTTVSPYSATVLYMSRITGASVWTIAWRWNSPLVLILNGMVVLGVLAVMSLNIY